MDRRHALWRGVPLAEHTVGAVLFADIAGFTAATEAAVQALGPQRGVETLVTLINQIYAALTDEIDRYGGSVVGFAGDALTVWFDGATAAGPAQAVRRAVACGLAMHASTHQHLTPELPGGQRLDFGLKAIVASGPIRRLLVGDPALQRTEVLAGATIVRMAAVAQQTRPGELVIDLPSAELLGDQVVLNEWRMQRSECRCAVVGALNVAVAAQPWPALPPDALSDTLVRSWLPPLVYERLHSGQDDFLTELRHTVSLFLRFSDLDYDHDAQAGARLDAFVRWVQRVVSPYEGWLMQVCIGDKGSYLHATFGAPIAHGDDALRAVSAALELGTPPDDLHLIDSIQIGISAGQSLAGAVGGSTCSYAVMGDSVNLAARLMEAAAPGQVLISANLAIAVSRRYILEPLPPIRVKGKSEAVPVMTITGAHQASLHLQEPQYALPMIGRGEAVALIEQRIARVQRGSGQIISITGDAGQGKSRLVAEIIRRATATGFDGFGGAAQLTSTQVPYYAWQPIWLGFFGLDPSALFEDQLAQLTAKLAELGPELLPRMPLLSVVLGLALEDNSLTRSMDPKQRKEYLEALLADCLRARYAPARLPAGERPAPLLLVLEDAHWLGALSIDLLAALGRVIERLPVLLVLACRPSGSSEPVLAAIERLPCYTTIHLGELPREDAVCLIEHKIALAFGPDRVLPDSFVERIITLSEGNPFHIEELLNYIQARGVALSELALAERLELPDSLASLILSRIDQLSTSQQHTLKVASVIGRIIRFSWLWGVYPNLGAEDWVRRDMDMLARMDITPLYTPEPELSYLFRHATMQEVVYESLPFALRAQLHEQLAVWLEHQAESMVPLDLLAYHYGRSPNRPKQIEYYRKAAEAAVARYANSAAIQYYERLLELLPLDEHPPVLLALGQVFERISAWEQAEARYQTLLALPHSPAVAQYQAHARAGVSETLRNRGRYAEAISWLESARAEFEALGNQGEVSHTLIKLSRVYWMLGDADRVQSMAEQSLALEGPHGDKRRVAFALQMVGGAALIRSDYGRAFELWSQSLNINREIGHKMGTAASSTTLAMIAFTQGLLDEGRELATESSMLFYELGARWEYALTQVVLAYILAAQGQLDRALELQIESMNSLRAVGAVAAIDTSLLGMAQVRLLSDPSPAAAYYAARLIRAGEQVHTVSSSKRMPIYQLMADRLLDQARLRIEPAVFEDAWASGATLSWTEAVEYALAGSGGFPPHLPLPTL